MSHPKGLVKKCEIHVRGTGKQWVCRGQFPWEPIVSTEPDIENRYQGASRHSAAPELRSWFSQFTSEKFQNVVLAKILVNNFKKGSNQY